MDVLRLGVKSKLLLPAYTIPQQGQIQAASVTYVADWDNPESLTTDRGQELNLCPHGVCWVLNPLSHSGNSETFGFYTWYGFISSVSPVKYSIIPTFQIRKGAVENMKMSYFPTLQQMVELGFNFSPVYRPELLPIIPYPVSSCHPLMQFLPHFCSAKSFLK